MHKNNGRWTDISKLYSVSIVMMLMISTLGLMISLPNDISPFGSASAEDITYSGITYVWDGEGADDLASTAENWYKNDGGMITNDIAPTNDSALVWNGTSIKDCTFDLDKSTFYAYSWSINSGYTGTITQGSSADISIGEGGYSQSAGTFKPVVTKYIYCDGSFTYVSGTLTSEVARIIMTGNGTTLTSPGNVYITYLRASANITYSNLAVGANVKNIVVDAGKTLTIATGKTLILYDWSAAVTLSNSGIIAGPGTFAIYARPAALTLTLGAINAPTIIGLHSASSSSRVITLGADATLGSTVAIQSAHASNTITFDLAGNDLIASSITTGLRGILLGGEGDIITTSWDSSVGTWTSETSNVHFTGTGTVKTATGQTFYDLTLDTTSNITQLSDIEVTNWLEPDSGIWNRNGYVLTAPMFTSSTEPVESMNENEFYEYYFMTNVTVEMSVNNNEASFLTISENEYGDPGLSGMTGPGDSGIYNIELEFTNTILGTVYVNYTLTVNNTIFCYITSIPETNWTTGTMYYYNVMVVGNGTITYNIDTNGPFIVSNLSGVISGMPDVGYYDIIFWAIDDDGNIAYQNWTLTVIPFTDEWTNDRIVDIALLVIIMGIITLFNYLGYVKNSFLLQILSFIVFIFVLVPLWPGSEIGGLLVLAFGIGNIGLLIGGLMK